MDKEQRELLDGMLYQMKRTYELSDDPQYDVTITQAYAQCIIALELGKIAAVLEKSQALVSPDESTV